MEKKTRAAAKRKGSESSIQPAKKSKVVEEKTTASPAQRCASPHVPASGSLLPTPPDSRSDSKEPPEQTPQSASGRPRRSTRLPVKYTLEANESSSESDAPVLSEEHGNGDSEYDGSSASQVDTENNSSEDNDTQNATSEDDNTEGREGVSEIEERATKKPARARKSRAPSTRTPSTRTPTTRTPTTRAPGESRRGLDPNLPPLSNIQDIFTDLTNNALGQGLNEALQELAGTKLRVATMCSGTESPLLALQLISNSLEKLGQKPLYLEHVFSAEIVPRKQAYIERNFKPPIIFRDVREFCRDDVMEDGATNVYGAKAKVPGDVDIVVAGSSCVDFSALNVKKGKVSNGESNDTLDGVLAYVEKWKPTVLIFENVSGAPWEKLEKRAASYGYQASFCRADTKDFYLPQTRTRGYMLWIRRDESQNHSKALKEWADLMKSGLKRRASAPASAFLLPGDDPRVHQFNSELSRVFQRSNKSRDVLWDACRRRHEDRRREESLGKLKPITQWVKGGGCVAFEHAHKPWLNKQVERVWDSIDIRCLRAAKDDPKWNPSGSKPRGIDPPGFDPLFKTMIMELSQNVDRGGETAFGICSCITPSGIFYLTDRAAPMTPHETLALQGIPLDKISLTLESMAEVQDLAGNAMSTTVVGAAELAALIVSGATLKRSGRTCAQLSVKKPAARFAFIGDNSLDISLDPNRESSFPDFDVDRMCAAAVQSRRRCQCEGTWETACETILVCQDCGHSACASCASKPRHNYRPCESARLNPHEFSTNWKNNLPLALQFKELPEIELLQARLMSYNSSGDLDQQLLKDYCNAVDNVRNEKLTFQCLKRTSYVPWVARYASPNAVAELEIGATAEWKLYIKPSSHLASKGSTRKFLQDPVARANLSPTQWAADWKWRVPRLQECSIEVVGSKGTKPSWRAAYGLLDYQEETIPKSLEIRSTDAETQIITGTFQHLSHCGTACSALYRRDGPEPLYLFMDPTRVGPVNEDRFVFSHCPERLDYGEPRETLATFAPTFRPWHPQTFSTTVTPVRWIEDHTTSLTPLEVGRVVKQPNSDWNEQSMALDCSNALAVLNIKCHQHGVEPGVYQAVENDMVDFFAKFSWMLENAARIPSLEGWRQLENHRETVCIKCSPPPPPLRWRPVKEVQKNGNTIIQLVAHEDPQLSADFEIGLKVRPSILKAEATVDAVSRVCNISIGINSLSLAHRAWSILNQEHATLSWNLDTNWTPYAVGDFPLLRLKNNNIDTEHAQPADFKLQLKPSQKRSLNWMRSQEKGVQSTLEEVEEEVIAPLHWKIEGRAQADITVKGGIVADQVSFGKTVTSLALIHQGFLDTPDPPPDDDSGLIHLRATLVVVPAQLPDQWKAQIHKCLDGSLYGEEEVMVIKTFNDLKSKRIQDFKAAKIIIVSFGLFESDPYMAQFQHITAMPESPSKEGRAFSEWFKYASKRIPGMNATLKEIGTKSFPRHLKQELDQTWHHPDFQGVVPTKRTKGAKYEGYDQPQSGEKAQKKATLSKASNSYAKSDDWEEFQCPVLHQFRFNRLIVDEFTYPMETKKAYRKPIQIHTHLTTLNADKRWALSGTPPLADFADIKRIATYLNVNLGIDSDAPGIISQESAKALRKEQTQFEEFLSFRVKRSANWHERRHQLAQRFLDRFARQNVAELQHIKCSVSLHPVLLRPHHMALYQELLAQLEAKDNDVKSAKPSSKDEGHRPDRIRQSLEGHESAEVALMTRATYDREPTDGVESACLKVVQIRKAEMDSYHGHMEGTIREAVRFQSACPSEEKKEYDNWASKYLVEAPIVSDKKTHDDLGKIIRKMEEKTPLCQASNPRKGAGDLKKIVRSRLTAMERKYVDFRRSLRFSRAVTRIHQSHNQEVYVECECGDQNPSHQVSAHASAVLTGCGHIVCLSCLDLVFSKRKCQVDGCDMDVDSSSSVLRSEDFCSHKDLLSNENSFGAKLDDILDLIEDRSRIKEDEQVIIFVQSQNMVDCVGKALKSRRIPYEGISRAEDKASDKIQSFVKNTRWVDGESNSDFRRVLVMNQTDETAAGTDLFNANHIIFVSPLFETTTQAYKAKMDQAIGRSRRLGQEKHVHVYRFVAMNTIDVGILEKLELRDDALIEGPEVPLAWDPENLKSKEKCRIVKDENGRIALVPASWVLQPE
ncbi:hypothetical protein HDK77DRAFT_484154 [Phyllosticta capitalensis]